MRETTTSDHVARAREIAFSYHRGQVDKSGADYITHPERVAARVAARGGSYVAVSAAWLHDVIEDCEISGQELALQGIPAEVVEVVQLLTRQTDVSTEDYYAAIREHPDALAVKIADIGDNLEPARTALLDPTTRARLRKKYLLALDALNGAEKSSSEQGF